MCLYICRHGETDWNAKKLIQGNTDIPLNARGAAQAEALARALMDARIERVYSSELSRARKTAEIAAARLGLKNTALPGLEEFHFGEWEGLSWDDVKLRYPKEYGVFHAHRRYTRVPGGESYQDLLARLTHALAGIAEGGPALVVTHGGCLLALLSAINRTPFEDMKKLYVIENAKPIAVKPGQILALVNEPQTDARE